MSYTSNSKYGSQPTTKELIQFHAQSVDITPRDIASAVYGVSHTRGEYDYVLQVLRESGIKVRQEYAESLWED